MKPQNYIKMDPEINILDEKYFGGGLYMELYKDC